MAIIVVSWFANWALGVVEALGNAQCQHSYVVADQDGVVVLVNTDRTDANPVALRTNTSVSSQDTVYVIGRPVDNRNAH